MRQYFFALGLMAILSCPAPCHGAVILFDHPRKDALLGVKINPTGPMYAPLAPDLLAFPGGAFALVPISTSARYYSANVTFTQPIVSVSMTIDNTGFTDLENDFTLVAFDQHQRVARATIVLSPVGDATRITLTAPSIDKIKWFGAGWTLHSYVVTNLNVTFAPATPTPGQPPQVGAAAPEPGFVAIAGPIVIIFLLRRPRREVR